MKNGGQNDGEARENKQQSKVPGSIYIEETERPINVLLRWLQLPVVLLKAVHVLLHYQHPDHAAYEQQRKSDEAKANRTNEAQNPNDVLQRASRP